MHQPPRTTGGPNGATATVLRLVERLHAALRGGERASIVELVGQLVEQRAHLGSQWPTLAQTVADLGELGLARRALDLFVEHEGGSPLAKYQKAAALAHADAWGEAYDLLVTLPEGVPDPTSHAYSRGMGLLNLGRAGEATEYLKRVVRSRPELGSPWLALALSADLGREESVAEMIMAAEPGMADAAPAERAPYYYALGKALPNAARLRAPLPPSPPGLGICGRWFPIGGATTARWRAIRWAATTAPALPPWPPGKASRRRGPFS